MDNCEKNKRKTAGKKNSSTVMRRLPAGVIVFIPNRTFLVRFGGISGEFGRAMVRPNELDMLPKRTKKRCD